MNNLTIRHGRLFLLGIFLGAYTYAKSISGPSDIGGQVGGGFYIAEIFNLFNHYNPDPQIVDSNLNSATFGSIGGGVSGITTRVIQLGAKLNF